MSVISHCFNRVRCNLFLQIDDMASDQNIEIQSNDGKTMKLEQISNQWQW
jgi:hypothetical protein